MAIFSDVLQICCCCFSIAFIPKLGSLAHQESSTEMYYNKLGLCFMHNYSLIRCILHHFFSNLVIWVYVDGFNRAASVSASACFRNGLWTFSFCSACCYLNNRPLHPVMSSFFWIMTCDRSDCLQGKQQESLQPASK